jgi:hypothetical protein
MTLHPRTRRDHIRSAEDAKRGILPSLPANFFTAVTHAKFVKRALRVEDAVRSGDLEKVKAFRAEPFWNHVNVNTGELSSSRVQMLRYMDDAIVALTVLGAPRKQRAPSLVHMARLLNKSTFTPRMINSIKRLLRQNSPPRP